MSRQPGKPLDSEIVSALRRQSPEAPDQGLETSSDGQPPGAEALVSDISRMIETARTQVAQVANTTLTTLYWQIGMRIRQTVLQEQRAEYGAEIVSALGRQLEGQFGRGFGEKSLRHMLRFAEAFPDAEIVSALRRQLSWTHFKRLIYLKDPLQRDFYAEICRIEGVMGRGIALQFRKAFPDNFKTYKAACDSKDVEPGRMFIHDLERLSNPRLVINFPTKRHWRGKSHMVDVVSGLTALVEDVKRLGIRSIAIPPLGCGLGGLDWADVRPRIEEAFQALPDVRVLLYEPIGAPPAAKMVVEKGWLSEVKAVTGTKAE